jgi:hypothetical protein
MTSHEQEIPSLPLQTRRRVLGYLIPIVNIPILTWRIYSISNTLVQNNSINYGNFIDDFLTIVLALILLVIIPQYSPLYTNRYWFTSNGIKITRFFKTTFTIPYNSINEINFYIRDERKGKPSQEALKFSRDKVNQLKDSGYRILDYTNDETKIALLFYDKEICMITPAKPKEFSHEMSRRVKKLKIITITLTFRGTRIKNGSP